MEEVDDFSSMFSGPPGNSQREAREARARKEKRTQLTEKQRQRKPTRTAQINFRCTPEFHAMAFGMQKHLGGRSIADVMELALEMLAKEKGYKGP